MEISMRTLNLEQLRTLVAVAEAGSLTAAAPRVFLSQSAVSEQLRKLEDEMQALGFAAAMGRGEGFCLLQWQANALQAWAPWYYFGGGIRLRHGGLVLSFSLGRPANMALRVHAGGPGAVGELRRQWLAIRGMRSRGRRWLAALAHERVGHGATGSRCDGRM